MREDIKAFVDEICCSETWETGSQEERDMGFGVACMQAYLIGIKPMLGEFQSYLEVDAKDIQPAFQRMLQCGLFSKAFNARGDAALNIKPNKKKSITDIRCAWGHVAGLAMGIINRNYNNPNVKSN